jgi:hypothetical protein
VNTTVKEYVEKLGKLRPGISGFVVGAETMFLRGDDLLVTTMHELLHLVPSFDSHVPIARFLGLPTAAGGDLTERDFGASIQIDKWLTKCLKR